MTDEEAPPISCGFGLGYREPDDVVLRILHTGQLNKLRARPVPIAREGHTSIDDFAVRIAVSTEYETAVLGAFVVIEEHAGVWPIPARILLASHDDAWEAFVI